MWAPIVRATNLMVAEMWRDLFDEELVPAEIFGEEEVLAEGLGLPRRVMVQDSKLHVAEEVLRKI